MSRAEIPVSEVEGVWEMVRGEMAGEAVPELVVRNTTIEFFQGTYRVRLQQEIVAAGTFLIGDSAGLKRLELNGLSGNTTGRRIPCIYQLTGNRLRICYGIDGSPPDEFTTSSKSPRYMAIYRKLGTKVH